MKLSIWLAGGVIVLVLLLGWAAFTGARLLGNPNLANDPQDILVSRSEGGLTTSGHFIEIEHAGEMPNKPIDAAGLLVRREDNSLFVGTGHLSGVLVDGDPRDSARWEYHHDGPIVEVVVTHATLIYQDDTTYQFADDLPSGPIQQVLIRRTLEEIEDNSTVSAWGERQGDRLIATVIVLYRLG